MLDLKEAKKFIAESNEKIRKLELDKAKTEERKKINDAATEDCKAKMKALGCTPDTIQSIIDEKSSKAETIKAKVEQVLNGVENEF